MIIIKKTELIKKLKPFWKKVLKLQTELYKKQEELEKNMNKKLKLNIELEFFYCDGECCGIGAKDFSNRKKFPLIQSNELY